MNRRRFLLLLGSALLLPRWTRARAKPFSVDDLQKLSSRLTGFPVDAHERALAKKLHRRLSSAQKEAAGKMLRGKFEDKALADRLVTYWYTETGFESLAWKSLDFAAPPLTCHGEWWKSPV